MRAVGQGGGVNRYLFVFFLCLYALSLGGGFYTSDGEVMFKTTAALVEHHTFALDPDPGLPQIVPGKDGRFYSKYDPGLSVLAAPFYVTGDWIAQVNAAHRYRVAALFVLLLPVIAAAGAMGGLARLVVSLPPDAKTVRLGQSKAWKSTKGTGITRTASEVGLRQVSGSRGRVSVLLAAGFATPLWVYARTLFTETILAAALTWTVVMIYRSLPHPPAPSPCNGDGESGHESDSPSLPSGEEGNRRLLRGRGLWRFLLAGVVFGLGLLTRAAFAIYLPALLWLIVRVHPSRCWRDHIIRFLAFGAGIAPVTAILLWHNADRFGDALQFGYVGEKFTTPVWEGVFGLLFSPGKSVFVYAPPLILSVILWPRFRRAYPALGDYLALAWGSALVFYGAWWAWHGGWCWGPRFLVPLMPLSCLPLINLTPQPSLHAWRGGVGSIERVPSSRMEVFVPHTRAARGVRRLGVHSLLWVLITLGIAIQLLGLLIDITPHYAAHTTPGGRTDYAALHTDPRESAVVYAAEQVMAGDTEPLALFHLNDTGLPPTWTTGVPVIGIMGLLWSGWRIGFRLHLRDHRSDSPVESR